MNKLGADTRLNQLRREVACPLPHPDLPALEEFSRQVINYLIEHFATLPQQPIGRTASRAEMEALLREPPPEEGRDFSAVLAEFEKKIAPYAFRPDHPRYLGPVPS